MDKTDLIFYGCGLGLIWLGLLGEFLYIRFY